MVVVDNLYEALNRYWNVVTQAGYIPTPEEENLLYLDFILDMIYSPNFDTLSREERIILGNILGCILKNSCLLQSMSKKDIMCMLNI